LNLNMNILDRIRKSFFSTVRGLVITLVFWQSSSLCSDTKTREDGVFPVMAYIGNEDGRDAIFLHDAEGRTTIFNCSTPNELILTPQVARNGEYITFVVDNGQNVRVLHLLGPITKKSGHWKASNSIVLTIKGGAWPLYDGSQDFYLAKPDQSSPRSNMGIYLYQVEGEVFTRLSDNMGASNHIWPLLSPEGDRIVFREVPIESDEMSVGSAPRSVIINLDSGNTETLFENQSVFLEQWIPSGEILYSVAMHDPKGTRAYGLYDPVTRSAVEIFRGNSRQGRLSADSHYLAFIRSEPINGAYFDIFIMDLESQTETNLTHSSKQSESIIGWIE